MYLRHKIRFGGQYLFRRRGFNAFHCCIQKSATQWFRKFMWALTEFPQVQLVPIGGKNFIPRTWKTEEALTAIPDGMLVSPLYIRYSDFLRIYGERNYKAFFVMRDPRDIVVSDYFSLKETHPIKNEYFAEWRYRLNQLEIKDGMALRINNMDWNFFEVLREWSRVDNPHIKLIKYEEFFGAGQREQARNLVDFLELSVSEKQLKGLLDRLSFRKKSGGRQTGDEDEHSHYRKGISGDWKNFFDQDLEDLFLRKTGNLLKELGYEK